MLTQDAIDQFRNQNLGPRSHFIDGQSCPSESGRTLETVSPIDGQVLTTLAAADPADMDRAITSARTAFEDRRWAGQPPAARKKVMMRWAELVEQHALELAVLGVRDNGTEIGMALKAEPFSAAGTIRYYAEAIDKVYGEIAPTADSVLALIHREPVGVVGAIVPWNFPLMIGAWKLAPALAAGNCVVLKPGETASLSLLRLAELASEAGLPDSVLQVVTGEGHIAGEALALSNDVNVLAFTGSGTTGRRLMQYSAQSNMKRLYLELGGKSPHIVFADTGDLDAAANAVANGIFRNSGQVCIAGSRLLVENSIAVAFSERVADLASQYRVGDPLDMNNAIGAVHSERELLKDLEMAETAQSQGADLVSGGSRLHSDSGGFYMEPTVLGNVSPDNEVFQKEVFGPVLAVTPFASEAEAIQLANGTDYGLASGVWTDNLSRAHRMVRELRAGVVHVNTYGGADNTVPLGGVKQSGNGADKSLHALDKYCDLKTAWIQL